MTYTFQREHATQALREEIEPLLIAHFDEIAHYQDIPLRPDWNFYLGARNLRCYTARQDGVLVGYAVFGLGINKHFMGSLQAVQDIIFIAPQHRHKSAGAGLVTFCDEQLRAEGVQVVYHHAKLQHGALGDLLRAKGYELIDLVYGKRLDRE
jgi:hypothetical protein